MNAQNNNLCATPDDNSPDPPGVYSYSIDPNILQNCQPIVLNIYIWGINRPDGTNDFPNRANDALTAIANLNIVYNEFGIYFKFKGFEEIDSPTIFSDLDCDNQTPETFDINGHYILECPSHFGDLVGWAASNGYKKADAFNLYVFGGGTGFGGIAYSNNTISGVQSSLLAKNTVVHEIGHNLTLKHTWLGAGGSSCERVTRDPNDSNYNAHMAGDMVIDTAAIPSTFKDPTCDCYEPNINLTNCTYRGDGVDCGTPPTPYEIFHDDLRNSLSNGYPCKESFLTMGQGIRAREGLLAGINGVFATSVTDKSSLYEPYSGGYYVSGPSTTGPPLFQPGFDYVFTGCCCDYPEPSDYEDTSFTSTTNVVLSISKYETDYSTITHPNHTAIRITSIDVCNVDAQNARKCYDNNGILAGRGSVMRFNDGTFNNNVTITPKDSVEINNPNLINDLPNGLYKIEKNLDDGSTEETVILKGNE